MLPESVVQRVKSPYPTTSDPRYGNDIQAQAREVLGSGSDTDTESLPPVDRSRPERILALSVWLDLYQPRIIV